MAKTVLVTGGAGFIGQHSVKGLQQNDFNTIVVDRKPRPKDYQGIYFQYDINDTDNVEKIFQENKIDFILHLAALPSVSESCRNPQKDCIDNYLATVNICSLAKKYNVKKIVFSSTAAVYANPKYLPVDEKHPTDYLSPYAITKNASENFIKYSGIDYIIFRYANVYGEGQDTQGEAGVVAIFFDKMNNNSQVTINGDGNQTRDFVYVKDIAKANTLAFLSDVKNETINVSSNSSTSINDLFCLIKNATNYSKKANYTKARIGDIRHSILNNDKLMKLLKFKPSSNLKQNIENMTKIYC